jgi:hypothetical protein
MKPKGSSGKRSPFFQNSCGVTFSDTSLFISPVSFQGVSMKNMIRFFGMSPVKGFYAGAGEKPGSHWSMPECGNFFRRDLCIIEYAWWQLLFLSKTSIFIGEKESAILPVI